MARAELNIFKRAEVVKSLKIEHATILEVDMERLVLWANYEESLELIGHKLRRLVSEVLWQFEDYFLFLRHVIEAYNLSLGKD